MNLKETMSLLREKNFTVPTWIVVTFLLLILITPLVYSIAVKQTNFQSDLNTLKEYSDSLDERVTEYSTNFKNDLKSSDSKISDNHDQIIEMMTILNSIDKKLDNIQLDIRELRNDGGIKK